MDCCTAPELFNGDKIDEYCDVYSFAILLWEMVTGKEPWKDVSLPMQVGWSVGRTGEGGKHMQIYIYVYVYAYLNNTAVASISLSLFLTFRQRSDTRAYL